MTAIYTAILLWILGLAVPVTATYIIAAVIAAPALTKMGVPDFAAHMFIFYYAVLSEVSPPTALSPFAAAALTGGDPYKTTMMAWKYTAVAFVVPFMFVLYPSGQALLLKIDSIPETLWVIVTAFAGVFAFAAAASGWLLRETNWIQRILLARIELAQSVNMGRFGRACHSGIGCSYAGLSEKAPGTTRWWVMTVVFLLL